MMRSRPQPALPLVRRSGIPDRGLTAPSPDRTLAVALSRGGNGPSIMERNAALLLACVLFSASVGAGSRPPQPAPGAEGEVSIYLQPFGREAERLAFSVRTAAVVDDAGVESPLVLRTSTAGAPGAPGQRLLASGRVRSGSYQRLSIAIEKASVRREGGAVALAVPDSALTVDVPFAVARGRVVVLWLTLAGSGVADGGAAFTPGFSARVAPRPLPSRAGFVSNTGDGTITVFDKSVHQAAAVIRSCGHPSGMALDQRRGRLFVACADEDEVLAIDVASTEVVERVSLPPGDGPRELALTPDGLALLAVNARSGTIALIDPSALARVDRLAVGTGPSAVAIDPGGRRAFVFNALSDSISVVDIGRRSVVATLATEASPLRGVFNARGDRLFVIHERSPYATVIEPSQLTVVNRGRLHIGLGALAFDTRRGLLYLGGLGDRLLEFYDPNTLLPVGTMRTPAGVAHLAIDEDQDTIYLASPDRRSVVVAQLAGRRVVAEIDVGEAPYAVSVMGARE